MQHTPFSLVSAGALLCAGLMTAHAAPTQAGNIVLFDKDNKTCTLEVPAGASGKTWQFDLNTVGSSCYNVLPRQIQLTNLPSATQILMTDAYWCNEATEPQDSYDSKDHWIKLRTTRQPTSTEAYGIHDWYAQSNGSIITPGLQLLDKYTRSGTPQYDTLSCIRVTTSAGPDTPVFPTASVGSRSWGDSKEEADSKITCEGNTVMTGRNHRGDERGQTKHECGVVSQDGNAAVVGTRGWSIKFSESDRVGNNEWDEGYYFSCPLNQVMTGREHWGDENGDTRYECAPLTVNGRQLDVTPGDWSAGMNETDSEHKCAQDQVMVGRWHRGDENTKGSTRYRCATVR
ncbi:hypothetical protein J2W83_004280 [Pseudomonas hunanensis]|uniref:Uncharacterized protein n=1 Tax=Pseudomonas hunanensis TaxID=1247546 RepID=A0ACC6K832_9PSED|nr:hypothetical protein [Pseudomonas hunanensis]MDR6714644.1 hypothetical protein [Pseudomonas hunanensis]